MCIFPFTAARCKVSRARLYPVLFGVLILLTLPRMRQSKHSHKKDLSPSHSDASGREEESQLVILCIV